MSAAGGSEPSQVRYGHCDWTDEPAPAATVPAGTKLTLGPDDWYPRPDVARDDLVLIVARVHATQGRVVWVRGHHPGCEYESSDCAQPWCVEVLVAVEALRRAARS